MTIRDTVLANITAQFATTSAGVSSELPWSSGGVALFDKNMKKFYLGAEVLDVTEFHSTFDAATDIYQKTTQLTGYLTVDAKNQPADMETIINSVLNSRLSVEQGNFVRTCAVSNEIAEDRITYVFEFNFTKIN